MRGLDDPAYLKAKADAKRLAGLEGIDKLLAEHQLDALIAPTTAPPWRIDVADGDHFSHSASSLPAVAGYPAPHRADGVCEGAAGGPVLHWRGMVGGRACCSSATPSSRRPTPVFAPTFAPSVETANRQTAAAFAPAP